MERTEFMDYLDGKLGRTEEQILNDFKKLGYEIEKTEEWLKIRKDSLKFTIYFKEKTYWYNDMLIGMKEHKLLHELFEIWGWLEK